MFIKNRKIRIGILIALAIVAVYSGISSIATLHKATIQPYLLEGVVEYHFLGYYMMAALSGVVCIVTIIGIVFIVRFKNK